MRYTYMNTFKAKTLWSIKDTTKKNFYSRYKSYKRKKHMEDNFFDSVKTLFTGILIISSSFLLKLVIPEGVSSLIGNETNVDTTLLNSLINMMQTLLSFCGIIFVIMGMVKFVNYVRCGEDYYSNSMNFDDEKKLEDFEEENDNEELETMIPVDAMLLENRKENKDDIDPFVSNNIPKIEDVPKQKSVQMIRCSICGREKEMGGICKRCKTC